MFLCPSLLFIKPAKDRTLDPTQRDHSYGVTSATQHVRSSREPAHFPASRFLSLFYFSWIRRPVKSTLRPILARNTLPCPPIEYVIKFFEFCKERWPSAAIVSGLWLSLAKLFLPVVPLTSSSFSMTCWGWGSRGWMGSLARCVLLGWCRLESRGEREMGEGLVDWEVEERKFKRWERKQRRVVLKGQEERSPVLPCGICFPTVIPFLDLDSGGLPWCLRR